MPDRIDLMTIIEKYDYSYTKAKNKAVEEMKKKNYTPKEMNLVTAMIDGYFLTRLEDEVKGSRYRRQAMHQELHLMY